MSNEQQPRTITHRLEDHCIVEEHYRLGKKTFRYDLTEVRETIKKLKVQPQEAA